MSNVGRVQVRSQLYSYLTGANISGLNQIFTAFPKRINFQVGATAGQLTRAAAVIHIAGERDSRIAIGRACGGERAGGKDASCSKSVCIFAPKPWIVSRR